MTDDPAEDEPLEVLDPDTCWRLLRATEIGRLAAPTPYGGVDIFPINHVVDQGTIVFRTALGSKLTLATEAHEVAFEIDGDGSADGGTAWSVVLHGRASLITGTTQIFDSFELSVRPWHRSNKPYFVRLVPTSVTGRRFHINYPASIPSAKAAERCVPEEEPPWSST